MSPFSDRHIRNKLAQWVEFVIVFLPDRPNLLYSCLKLRYTLYAIATGIFLFRWVHALDIPGEAMKCLGNGHIHLTQVDTPHNLAFKAMARIIHGVDTTKDTGKHVVLVASPACRPPINYMSDEAHSCSSTPWRTRPFCLPFLWKS